MQVRKKSAKVLEMEEAEKMEKSLSKKVQDTVKGLRETLGGMKTPTKVNISIPSLQKSAAGCGSDVNLLTASAVSFMEGDTEPVDSVVNRKSLLLKCLKQIIRVFLLLIDKRGCFKRQANSSFTL